MNRLWLWFAFAAALLPAQENPAQQEAQSLQQALGEAGNSPVEFVRALERHLKQYPDSPRRAELERALVKTAIDLNDDARVLQFGAGVLARDPDNLQVLEHFSTALLRKGDKAGAERALEHIRHFGQLIQATYKDDKFVPGGGRDMAKRKDDFDRGLARARLLEARAQGLLGHPEEAIRLAQASYGVYPNVEAAREAARWLSATGKDKEAIQYLADAFSIAALRSADQEAANDRARMSELYKKVNGSEAGLGELVLKSYDHTSSLLTARRAELRQYDPNAQVKDPMRFTLSGLDGDKLALASLSGKVVVLDFWATWCVPCRQQHELYQEVKARFKDSGDVVFVSVDTDEDHSLVKPFMEASKWTQKVYFEDGLSSLLQISSIPTTMVYGKKGELVSRMIGFVPERFVDMLSDRIDEALGKPPKAPAPPKALSIQ